MHQTCLESESHYLIVCTGALIPYVKLNLIYTERSQMPSTIKVNCSAAVNCSIQKYKLAGELNLQLCLQNQLRLKKHN